VSVSPVLEVNHLVKVFTTGFFQKKVIKAVDDVSFEISKEEPVVLTLAGESGSGKSTICKLLLKLMNPTSGKIFYNGRNLSNMSRKEMLAYRKDVQPVFQSPYETYNPFYRVDHMLKMPIRKLKLAGSDAEENRLIAEALEVVGLLPEKVLNKYPHEFSGGERQRIMLCRAILTKPQIILADEPVSMIDASLRANILDFILDQKKIYGRSFVYITHDLSTAYHISDRILILYRGSVVESGEVERVLKNPLHPYLKELIESIPIPDPEKRWKKAIELKAELTTCGTDVHGCKFYRRCPARMKVCLSAKPKPIQKELDHVVTCYLYSDSE